MNTLFFFAGQLGAAVLSWLGTFFLTLYPYYWMVDHVWTDGEAPDWFFAAFLLAALVAATKVAKLAYRRMQRANINLQSNQMMMVAVNRASNKMQKKYPHLVKYVKTP